MPVSTEELLRIQREIRAQAGRGNASNQIDDPTAGPEPRSRVESFIGDNKPGDAYSGKSPVPGVAAAQDYTKKKALHGMEKIYDAMRHVDGIAAGVVKYQRAKIEDAAAEANKEGKSFLEYAVTNPPKPDPVGIARAGVEGWKKKTEWSEATKGMKGFVPPIPIPGRLPILKTYEVGKPLDILMPTSMALPINIPARLASKFVVKEVAEFMRGADELAGFTRPTKETAEFLKAAGTRVAENFNQGYRLKNLGVPELGKLKREHAGELQAIANIPQSEFTKRAVELVPDAKRMEHIYIAVDQAPVKRIANPTKTIKKYRSSIDDMTTRKARLEKKAALIEAQISSVENSPDILSAIEAARGKAKQRALAPIEKNIDRLSQKEISLREKTPGLMAAHDEATNALHASSTNTLRGDKWNVRPNKEIIGTAITKERARAAVGSNKTAINRIVADASKEGRRGAKAAIKDFPTREEALLDKEIGRLHRGSLQIQKEIAVIESRIQSTGENILLVTHMDEMVKTGEYAKNVEKYKAAFDALSPNEKEAADLLKAFKDIQQAEKLKEGFISQERALNVEQRIGHEYFPRRANSKDEALAAINRAIDEQGQVKWLVDKKAEIEAMPRNEFMALVQKAGRKLMRRPGFTKKRTIGATLDEMGEARGMFDMDLPAVLEGANIDILRTKADKSLITRAHQLIENRGISRAVEQPLLDSGSWVTYPKYMTEMGWVPKDVMVPKEIAGELFPMMGRMISAGSGEGLEFIWNMVDRATGLYRNWNLFVAPEYFIRNVVGNYLNNYAVHGMGVSSFQDYVVAGRYNARQMASQSKFLRKSGWTPLSETELMPRALSPKDGMTEVEFMRWAEQQRIINAGQTAEAAIDFRGYGGSRKKSGVFNWINEENKLISTGHDVQRITENDARLAAYFYQVRRGKSPEQAIDGVLKSLFDYQLGLTNFERKWVRKFFPFYSWSRFNFPLQLEMLSQYPSRYLDMARGARAIEMTLGGPDANEAYYPDYIKDSLHMRIRYDAQTETYYVLNGKNWVPAADLETTLNPKRWPREIMNQFTPIIGAPIDMFRNINSFRSTPEDVVYLEDFKGEKENILGLNVPKRTVGAAMHEARIIRILDNIKKELSADEPIGSNVGRAIGRTLVGKAQPVNIENSRRWFMYNIERSIKNLEYERNKAERDGDTANVKVLNKLIADEVRKREEAIAEDQ